MRFIEKHKRLIFIIAIVLCLIVSILTLNYKKPTFLENLISYITSPAQKATSGIGGWISEKIDFISNLNELEQRNKELEEEVERLKLEIGRMDLLEKDNERLTSQLELRGRYPSLPLVGAYVSAKDSNNWSSSFMIDKGTNDGISENMVILADGGLVGRVYKANISSSLIVPIMDDSSSVGAQVKRTGEPGFVKGDLRLAESGYCRMENIDINADILENDEIVTSLLGDIYPPGITIGYVREISADPDGLTKQAVITPLADFKHMDTVLIINRKFTDESGAENEPAETLIPETTGN